MGLFDLFGSGKDERSGKPGDVAVTRTALERAEAGEGDDGAVTRLVQRLLDLGLDGAGPLDSAGKVADEARRGTSSTEDAIDKVVRSHLIGGGAGGFVTGVGGFVTLPIALPVNVLEFYVQATRMVGAVARLRGYDIADPRIRTAVLLTLIGSNADDVLAKAGMATGGGRVASLAGGALGPAARLAINKGVGFRLLRGVGEKGLSRLGRGIPLAGGVVGAALDGYMMKQIADQAKKEFPQRTAPAVEGS